MHSFTEEFILQVFTYNTRVSYTIFKGGGGGGGGGGGLRDGKGMAMYNMTVPRGVWGPGHASPGNFWKSMLSDAFLVGTFYHYHHYQTTI